MILPEDVIPSVTVVCNNNGPRWDDVVATATEIVLFGSRAVGWATEQSDWDLLCVGEGQRIYTKQLDLIWISDAQVKSLPWLGSELAGHIAAFGVWLAGTDSWSHLVAVSDAAIRRKRTDIERRLSSLSAVWHGFGHAYRERHLGLIRRQVQRLEALTIGVAIPPNPMLDESWLESNRGREGYRLMSMAANLGVTHPVLASLQEFGNLMTHARQT